MRSAWFEFFFKKNYDCRWEVVDSVAHLHNSSNSLITSSLIGGSIHRYDSAEQILSNSPTVVALGSLAAARVMENRPVLAPNGKFIINFAFREQLWISTFAPESQRLIKVKPLHGSNPFVTTISSAFYVIIRAAGIAYVFVQSGFDTTIQLTKAT